MNANDVVSLIAALIILIGSIMAFISVIGLLRFKDVYTRSHAATKSATLGVMLTLLGAFIYFLTNDNYFSIRLILGVIFIYLTSPVAGHLIVRAADHSKVPLYKKDEK